MLLDRWGEYPLLPPHRPLFLWINSGMMINARIYTCPCCGSLVMLCSHCDRGNIYCFKGCAQRQRSSSLRGAGRRYRQSLKGRLNGAQRQARYRARRRQESSNAAVAVEKVTHHGSDRPMPTVSMARDEYRGVKLCPPPFYRCHCCGRGVSPLLRSRSLRRHGTNSLYSSHFPP